MITDKMDWIDLDTTPVEEQGAQVGEPDALRKMKDEARRMQALLRQKLGEPPMGVSFGVYRNEHDFGPYYSLRVYYDTTSSDAVAYALACEGEFPETWNDTTPVDWRRYRSLMKGGEGQDVVAMDGANANAQGSAADNR
ncbi:MAG: hypothetical protein HY741_08890 [Chloroflexi bacterium]|nr:hypothetical protein [Chloroflexota bacterium]